MTNVALQEVATIHGGGRFGLTGADFAESGFPAYGAGGANGLVAVAEYDRPGVILSSIGARCGKCFYADGKWTSLANTQVILPQIERVDPRFLWYQLNDEQRWPRSGTGQPFIKPSDVKAHRIALPHLDEQRRIAAILDQADALRARRRQVLAHLGSLTQSILQVVLADSSASGWARLELGELLSGIDSGTSPNCETRPAQLAEWGVLKLGSVTYGEFRPGENKALLGDTSRMRHNEVHCGDVLMTRKNTREHVGAVAVVGDVRPRLLLPDLIFRLHLDRRRVDSTFFQALMMSPQTRRAVQNLSSGSAGSMPNISRQGLSGCL